MTANLINIPENAQIGVRYQVNLSGSGWLDWAADGAETGGAGGEMPLEAVRMELTGASAENYDLYYRVYQNGSWTDWLSMEPRQDRRAQAFGLTVCGPELWQRGPIRQKNFPAHRLILPAR